MNSILVAVPKPAEREKSKLAAWTSFVQTASTIRIPMEGVQKLGEAAWLIENETSLPFFGQVLSLATNAQIAAGLDVKVFFVEQWTQWNYSVSSRLT